MKHIIDCDTNKLGIFYKEFILCKDELLKGSLKMGTKEFGLVLTHMYFECPNYSELSRRTGVSRITIANAVKSTINKFKLNNKNN